LLAKLKGEQVMSEDRKELISSQSERFVTARRQHQPVIARIVLPKEPLLSSSSLGATVSEQFFR
jgi:hypothetical protein